MAVEVTQLCRNIALNLGAGLELKDYGPLGKSPSGYGTISPSGVKPTKNRSVIEEENPKTLYYPLDN